MRHLIMSSDMSNINWRTYGDDAIGVWLNVAKGDYFTWKKNYDCFKDLKRYLFTQCIGL